jgi:hypothetical protein
MNKGIKISIGLSLLMAAASSFAGAPAQVPVTGEVGGAAGSTKGVAWPSPRFVAGTGATVDCITDKLTGLMWPKNGIIGFSNGADPYTPLATPELNNTDATHSLVKWSSSGSTNEVFAAIANLNNATTKLCGYSDWRLPNKVELKSMINYGAANPATWLMYGTGSSGSLACDGACFANVQANRYWSSSTFASNTSVAWVVNFSYGYVGASNKASVNYVWPVRGGQ